MQLREIIKRIRQEKNWTQVQMAAELHVSQQNIQGMENAGSNLEKQWSLFLKLIPVCRDVGIDPAQDLNVAVAEKETTRYVKKQADQTIVATHSPATRGNKKKIIGRVQKSRIASSSGKNR